MCDHSSKNDIAIKVNTGNVTGLLAVAKMFNELAAAAETPTTAFAEAGTTDTPVLDPKDAFQQPAPTQQTVAPQAPVAPSVPTQQTVAPQAPVATVVPQSAEVDSAGMPWDSRIHAKTRTKCQDGTWKKGKGVDPNVLAAVEMELKSAMTAPVAPVTSLPNLDGKDDGFPSPPTNAIPATIAPVPPTPAAPVVPAVDTHIHPLAVAPAAPQAPAAPVAGPTTFPDLMSIVTGMQTSGKITFPEIVAVCQQHGLANLALIATRPDLIPQVYRDMEAIWTGR